jgi:hypothetical protein
MTGARDETAFAGEGKKTRMEPDEVTLMFGDRGGHVVQPHFTRAATEFLKSMNVAAGERFETLAVSELQIHLSAVRFDEAESVEFARGAVINESAKVSPVHIEAFAGRTFHSHICAACGGAFAQRAQMIFDDGQAAVISQRLEMRGNDGRVGIGISFKQFGDCAFPCVNLALAIAGRRLRRRGREIFGDGAPADVHVARNFPRRPLLDEVQAMQFADLFGREHL